jgi:hypothetical protein
MTQYRLINSGEYLKPTDEWFDPTDLTWKKCNLDIRTKINDNCKLPYRRQIFIDI